MRSAVFLLSLFCLLEVGKTGCPYSGKRTQGLPSYVAAIGSPLSQMDQFFVQSYERSRSLLLDEQILPEAIIYLGVGTDSAFMRLTVGNVTAPDLDLVAPIVPQLYTLLKEVAHTAFTLFLLLNPLVYSGYPYKPSDPPPPPKVAALDAPTIEQLSKYRSLFDAANASLDQELVNCTSSQIARAKSIFSSCDKLWLDVTTKGNVSYSEIQSFARAVAPLVKQNINDSAIAQVNLVHSQVMAWHADYLTESQWESLHVLVLGSHMPRHRNFAMQYFSRLLKTPIESGLRVIYAEGQDEAGALQLLGTHVNDFTAGQAFFDDPDFMHSDILADATEAYLKHLLPDGENDMADMLQLARP